ncbi:hypothetical protein GQ53DRAFT_820771 [Thozetella sp. PMI_491]|nr:hypothetical protein GQ53DRAFT_820771 [Thozetella sp. PMI_491]
MAPAEVEGAITTLEQSLGLVSPALGILDGFNHRNKNQHRLSRWFAEFSSLRRHLGKLVPEIQANLEKLERFAKYKKSPPKSAYDDKVKARVKHLVVQVVPRAFLSFSQLAADNQYAHLGLMLLGALAQVDKALRLVAPEPTGSTESTPLLPSERRLAAGSSLAQDAIPQIAPEDIGVAVPRDPATTEDQPTKPSLEPRAVGIKDPAGEEAKETDSTRSASKKQKKKKQKDGDEFDALFDALEPKKVPKKKKKRKADEFDDLFGSLI